MIKWTNHGVHVMTVCAKITETGRIMMLGDRSSEELHSDLMTCSQDN